MDEAQKRTDALSAGGNIFGASVGPVAQINDFVAVAARLDFSAALRANGTVVAWGSFGQHRAFVPNGLGNVTAIATGGFHCLALRDDGTVAAWGADSRGLLAVPSGLSDVIAVAAGSGHSLALCGDGSVVAWGDNSEGACDVPTGLGDVVDVAVVDGWSVAIRRDGTVAVWGEGGETLVEEVEDLQNVLSISGKTAVKRNGTVVTLGGAGTNTYGSELVDAPAGLSGVVGVAGDGHTRFGLLADGTVVGWGLEAGAGEQHPLRPPGEPLLLKVPEDLGNVAAIAAGEDHVLALHRDGHVVAWGENRWGQLDLPPLEHVLGESEPASRTFPNAVLAGGSEGFGAVAAGLDHSLGLKNDGTVVAWGSNSRGQLDVPDGLTGVVAIDAGEVHNIALLADATVITWGGTVGGPVDQPDGLVDVLAVAAGGKQNLALRRDGTVLMWNQTFNKCLELPNEWADIVAIGLGPSAPIALRRDGQVLVRPSVIGLDTAPANLAGVVSVAAEGLMAYGLCSDGRLVQWGTEEPLAYLKYASGRAFRFPELTGVVTVSAGWNHALALLGDGSVAAWGDNAHQKATVPDGLGSVVAIAAGPSHSLAVRDDGTVIGWGSNKDGQLEVPQPRPATTDSSMSRSVPKRWRWRRAGAR